MKTKFIMDEKTLLLVMKKAEKNKIVLIELRNDKDMRDLEPALRKAIEHHNNRSSINWNPDEEEEDVRSDSSEAE